VAVDVTPPVLSVRNLSVAFDMGGRSLPVLSDCSLDVHEGEMVGIVGESGCGKSTLSLSLLRLLPANASVTGGVIKLGGCSILELPEAEMRQKRGREVAMVFQDPATSLNPSFTIGTQMLDVARGHRDGDRGELRADAVASLTEVGIADPVSRLRAYAHECSGGMRQRMMIATALQLRPRLLIADEITSALDVTLERQILELLRRVRDEHRTAVLFVSHDLGVIASTCDRVMVMYAGRVVEEGTVDQVFSSPQHPYTSALLRAAPSYRRRTQRLVRIPGRVPSLTSLPPACKFAGRCPSEQENCRETEPPLATLADGRGVRCYFPGSVAEPVRVDQTPATSPAIQLPATQAPSPAVLDVHDLSTVFVDRRNLVARLRGRVSEVRAVDGVDLQIRQGEVMGLVGESGSGKTTLGRTILGLTRPTSGRATYRTVDTGRAGRAAFRRLRSELQMVYQDPHASLSPRMTVRQLLIEPYEIHDVPRKDRTSIEDLLETVELAREQADKFPHELSGGQARRVGIARVLALRPRFVVADEPTAGLDVSAAAGVLNLMADLQSRFDLTYIFITHNLNLLGYVADRIAVMYLGQIVEIGSADAIFERAAHPYTLALLSSVSEPADGLARRRPLLAAGEIPSPRNPPTGCRYHTRCPLARELCRSVAPVLTQVEPGQMAACHFWQDVRDLSVSGQAVPVSDVSVLR
jgi:oligopeptide/dipeptide ABC transporter ATP-binding protein